MGNATVRAFARALDGDRDFAPIRVSSLRVDTVTGFDLYLQVKPGEPAVLYAERSVPFTEESRQRLVDNEVEHLYISAGQEGSYRRYLEQNLQSILADLEVSAREKSEVLHTSAQGLVRDVFENPEMEGALERSRDVVENTVDFLFSQEGALRNLITTASVDYEIFSHSMNVCILGVALAHSVGFSKSRVLHDLGTGALLRDIGLRRIDPEIVGHSGKLTVAQFEELKTHPESSASLLHDMGEVSDLAIAIARHHHERLDGSGYPGRLAGDEIAPLIRVITIADVFDALTTNRRHKRAVSSYDALRLMSSEMRGELDRDLLRDFIGMMGNPR